MEVSDKRIQNAMHVSRSILRIAIQLGMPVVAAYLVTRYHVSLLVIPVFVVWAWHSYRIQKLSDRILHLETKLSELDEETLKAHVLINNTGNLQAHA